MARCAIRYRPFSILVVLRVVFLVSLVFQSPFVLAQPATTKPIDSSAVLTIFSRSLTGTTCGNGFVIGDGTLVVTARHVIFPERLDGRHRGDAFVTAISAHLGDACELDIVGVDAELDVAILRGKWKGHPSYALAEDDEVAAASEGTILGATDAVAAVVAARPALLAAMPAVETAKLAIESVTVRQGATRTIVTASAPPGAGWAGAPLLIGDRADCAGCYSRTQGNGAAGVAAAAGPIRRLIAEAKLSDALSPSKEQMPAAPDGAKVAALYLQSIAASAARDSSASSGFLDQVLKLRPGSAIALRDAAGQARAANRVDEAIKLYARAIGADPALVSARVLYAQVLDEKVMPDHALEQLKYAWEHGRGSSAAVIPMCNILRKQGKLKECSEVLTKAVEEHPDDSFLWRYLGQARVDLRDHAGAAAAFVRAADLMPENESARVDAAGQYEAAGDAKRAEAQYRVLVEQHPNSSAAHYFLARFLGRDASRKEEALREAGTALKLSDRPGAPPKARIQALISAIKAGRASPGDELRL